MLDEEKRTIISCPDCGTRLSVTVSQDDAKAFNCSNADCRSMFTVLPDLSVHKGDHRKAYKQRESVLAKIRSLQEQLADIPEPDIKEERALINDLKEKVKALRDNPSQEIQHLDGVIKEKDALILSLQEEIASVKNEIDSLKASMSELEEEKEQMEKVIKEAAPPQSDPELERKFRTLQQKFKEQASVLKEVLTRNSYLENAAPSAGSEKTLVGSQLESLQKNEKAVRDKSILLDDREMELEARDRGLQEKEKDLATREEGVRLSEEDVARSKAELLRLQGSYNPMKEQLEQDRAMLKREREELLALKSSIPMTGEDEGPGTQSLQEERSRLSAWEKELSAREERLSVESRPDKADDRLTRLKDALQKKNEELQQLKRAFEESERRSAAASAEVLRIAPIEAENASIKEEMEKLRSDLSTRSALSGPTAEPSWKAEMEERESALAQRTDEVQKREIELSTYRAQLTDYHADLTRKFEEFGRENARLQEDRAAFEANIASQGSPDMASRLERAESEATALRTELEKALANVEKRNQAILRMQEKIAQANASVQSPRSVADPALLKERDAEIEDLRSRITELKGAVLGLGQENASMKETLERTVRERTAELESMIIQRDQTIEELRSNDKKAIEEGPRTAGAAQDMQTALEQAESRIGKLRATTSDLAQENRTLKERISTLERTATERSGAGGQMERENALLRGKLSEMVLANKELSDEKQRMIVSMDEKARSGSDVPDLSAAIAEKETRISALEKALEYARAASAAASSTDGELRSEIASLRDVITRMEAERTDLERISEEEAARLKAALIGEQERVAREIELNARLKDRLRAKAVETSALEKRIDVLEQRPPETVFECPYCKSPIPEGSLKDGACPVCRKRFKVAEEIVVEVYECPSCARTLSKGSVEKGSCAFCGARFRG